MNVIYFLIPLAMVLLAFGVAAFLWAVKSGQFDDLDREAYRILFDEDEDLKSQEPSESQKDQLH
ncbi:MAG: cbb3-type cytochrome oxidase assembly protein CcoS [Pseudomonadales bacterium]|nr:cbb3-type cytochrome oxidase assembly protein CcoS [Pseudomonadales bacterium]